MENVRIILSVDAKDLDPTIKKLKDMGIVSDTNKVKFEEAGKKFQQSAKHTADEVDRIGQKMQNLGEKIVAVFAVDRILHWAEECITAFEDAEQRAKELAFAVKNIAKEGDEAFEKLIKQ